MWTSKSTAHRLALALVLTSLVATGCGSDDADGGGGSGGGQGEPYKVGFLGPLTGALAATGTPILDGARAYFGAHPVHGKTVEVVPIDTQGQNAQTASGFQQLVERDHVLAVMGVPQSANLASVTPVAEQLKTPLFTSSMTRATLMERNPYVYADDVPVDAEAPAQFAFAQEELELPERPKVFLMALQAASSVTWQKDLETLADENGWEIVGNESVPVTLSDLSGVASKINSSGADVVLSLLIDPQVTSIVRGLQSLGSDIPIVNPLTGNSTQTLLSLKYPNLYVARSYPGIDETKVPVIKQFVADVEKAGVLGEAKANSQVQIGYFIAMLIARNLEDCGADCDAAGLQAAAEELKDWDADGLIFDTVNLTSDDKQAIESQKFYHYDGKGVVALPALIPASSYQAAEDFGL